MTARIARGRQDGHHHGGHVAREIAFERINAFRQHGDLIADGIFAIAPEDRPFGNEFCEQFAAQRMFEVDGGV